MLLWSRPHPQDVLNAWATAPQALVKFTTARQSRALHRPMAACSASIAELRYCEYPTLPVAGEIAIAPHH